MLNWQMITETLFRAETQHFCYEIEPVDGQWHWSLEIGGHYICQDGPFGLDNAKAEAQADYTARIAHAEKVIGYGQYTAAD